MINFVVFSLLVVCSFSFSSSYVPPPYLWKTKYYPNMPVDHFAFSNDDDTFQMRYLINDTFWDRKDGPIFFYCGNEGDITMFANNSGFMFDLAPEFRALLVFAEHRYYGETMPYGNRSYEMPYLGKLSSEQALADFAEFLVWLKANTTGAKDSPVIAFGGSYGGMLAAWMRVKYPHVILGSLASSAPVVQFTGFTPCWTYSSIVTSTFHDSVEGCDKAVKKSWPALRKKAQTSAGRAWLNENFRLCNDSRIESEVNATGLINWLVEAWGYLAMIDYPYPTNFLNPVPAWPVKEACKHMAKAASNDDEALLIGVYNAVSIYQNYTGQTACYSFTSHAGGGLGTDGWDFQACTEMVMPMCNNGTDMFEEQPWNLTAFADGCHQRYGVRSRRDWAMTNYGSNELKFASNIIFSNGLLDPWYGGGVLQTVSDSVVALKIKDSAHHYDLRGKHADDTQYVTEARDLEAGMIRKWIDKYYRLVLNRSFENFTPGWNDPPKMTYSSPDGNSPATKSNVRNLLNRRVAFPVNGQISNPAPMISGSMPIPEPTPCSQTTGAALPNIPVTNVTPATDSINSDPVDQNSSENSTSCKELSDDEIMAVLDEKLNECQSTVTPATRDSVQKRLSKLKDALAATTLSAPCKQKLISLIQALKETRYDEAYQMHSAMMIDHFNEVNPWMVGLKALILECQKLI